MTQLYYDDFIQPAAPLAPAPINQLLPPALCPQPCPVRVDLDFCTLPPWPHVSDDRWGNPHTVVPPGVRTEPYWTPGAIKASPGGPVLVGPGQTFIYPAPQLPAAARGLPIAAGGILAPSGGPEAARQALAPGKLAGFAQRVPWWGWALAVVVAARVLGGGR